MSEPNRQENFNSSMEFTKWLFGGYKLERDTLNYSLITTGTEHHYVHQGDFYTYSDAGTIDSGTVNALIIVAKPPLGSQLHFQAIVSAKNSGWAQLFENITYSGGSTISPKNNNRTSSKTFSGTMIINPTLTSFGTILQTRAIGASAPGVRIGGEGETRNEWIMNDDYWYAVWFYADNNSTQISLDFEGYVIETP